MKTSRSMNAITLHQPWATMVALGKKKIETRSWYTSYRGPLAIHAGKHFPPELMKLTITEPFLSVFASVPSGHPLSFPLVGHILCTCQLVDCIRMTAGWIETIQEPERSFGYYEPGRYAWLLEDIEMLETPVPARGYPRLWGCSI